MRRETRVKKRRAAASLPPPLLPGSPKTRGFSLRSPQLDAFRKAEVSRPGSLDSHWHRPLHITSFLSLLMLTRRSKAVNVSTVAFRKGRKSAISAPKSVREADSFRRPNNHEP